MMNPNDAKSIFLAAVERKSRTERDAYLNDVCGQDSTLRKRVEALLRAHDDPDSDFEGFISRDGKASDATIHMQPPSELIGNQLGPYKLLQQIGEGGMGVVYHGRAGRAVQRKVALKIIKPGMDSRQVSRPV